MGVLLDLSVYKDETADIRMENGAVLHLKKPSERMVIHMLQMREIDDSSPALEVMAALNRMAMEILNNNADGLAFTLQNVAEMSTNAKTEILSAYSDWAVNLQQNPTYSSPDTEIKARTKKAKGSLPRRLMQWLSTRT